MTIHYHGTPINPLTALYAMAGKHFCVSHARPDQVTHVHRLGQSVLLDNGAFSKWKAGTETNWTAYYAWCDRWLDFPTTWAIIPDVIDGGGQMQDSLISDWPHGHRGAPVWHMDENFDRLVRLTEEWPRVCIGSTGEFAEILTDPWRRQMDLAWNAIAHHHQRTPWVHMLRGMQLSTHPWPFASVDSSDVAQNHNRVILGARRRAEAHAAAGQIDLVEADAPAEPGSRAKADRWDAANTPARWALAEPTSEQRPLVLP